MCYYGNISKITKIILKSAKTHSPLYVYFYRKT